MDICRRVSVLCLPASRGEADWRDASKPPLTNLAILPDGNTRAAGGRPAGARKVVSAAAALARRGDVGVFYAAVMSPENDERRSDAFIEEVAWQFLVLGTRIAKEGLFLADGIRCLPDGELDELYRKGGPRARLAAAVEACCEMTSGVQASRMVLYFGLRYRPTFLRALDIPNIVRTGMEEPAAVRLSGILPHPRGLSVGSMVPWPAIELDTLHEIVDGLRRHAVFRLDEGYSVASARSLIRALVALHFPAPMEVTLPLAGPFDAALQMLRDANRGEGAGRVAIAPGPSQAPSSCGAPASTPIVVRVVPASTLREADVAEHDTVLAPGQEASVFALDGIPVGYATVHSCATGTEGICDGLVRAVRFARTHLSLRGGDRPPPVGGIGDRDTAPVAVVESRPEWHVHADAFVARQAAWAVERGLMVDLAGWRQAKTNYDRTAFYSLRSASAAERWSADRAEIAEAMSQYMVLVAAGDQGVFDLVVPSEPWERHRHRLDISAGILTRAVAGHLEEIPRMEGSAVLERTAAGLVELRGRHAPSCHVAALAVWSEAMNRLYAASVAEYDPAVIANPLIEPLMVDGSGASAAMDVLEQRYLAHAPAEVGVRVRELVREGGAEDGARDDRRRELAVHLYLVDVAPTIGAAAFFKSALLAWPVHEIDVHKLALLESATALLDMVLRAQNDRSDLLRTATGDRDTRKRNAGTILVPEELSPVARARELIQADVVCERVIGRLRRAFEERATRLAAFWPSMGELVQRASAIGYLVYSRGHYETLTREQMYSIAEEVDRAAAAR